MWTASPARSSPIASHSPVCTPARSSMPRSRTASRSATAQRMALAGPSNVDSAQQPPAGSPNYLLDFTTNALDFWKFHVDWKTPSNSSLTGPKEITVPGYTIACNNPTNNTCIPQSGTTQQLDALGQLHVAARLVHIRRLLRQIFRQQYEPARRSFGNQGRTAECSQCFFESRPQVRKCGLDHPVRDLFGADFEKKIGH